MRKVFFSLVATLAFGSFAMANNVDVETVEKVSLGNIEYMVSNEDIHFVNNSIMVQKLISDCYNNAYNQWEGLMALVGSDGYSDADIALLNAIVNRLCHQR